MLNICLVEDNKKLWDMLHQELLDEWYTCDRYTSVEFIDPNKSSRYHIFLLDVMLPGQDGISFAQKLREQSRVWIILLTAKSTLEDKEEWFEAWADDYITKPFKTKELCMRINALAERLEPTHFFQFNDIYIDWKNHLVKKSDQLTHLTPTERELVWCLIRNRWILWHRADLIEYVRWTDDLFSMNRSLDVCVANIRKKLWKDFIDTIPWMWYKLWWQSK